ncbi:hypothetical protein CC86DRAFT_365350 [Ophiobolus disseminans]|uniref:Uncharacterized protein n=1 Tax=Ophiobolus disseminans TaxID=1469910 RepID=A0A6A7ALB3_9PLEO|nr:hypothetical protein CC86DRAFT_365350 [Ophiobolus disseminans]
MDWFAKRPPAPMRRCSSTRNEPTLMSTKRLLLDLEDDIEVVSRDTPLHIFQLPRELRDLIYDILWLDIILAYQQENFIVIARYKTQNIDQPPQGIPEWLRVREQMRSESIERFHAAAPFSVGEIDRLPAFGHRHSSEISMAWESVFSNYVDIHWSRDGRPFSVFSIKEIRSKLVLLQHAKHVKVSALEIEWSVRSQDRYHCQYPFQDYCHESCCQTVLGVAIRPCGEFDLEKLMSLLDTGENGMRRCEVSVRPGHLPWSGNILKDTLYVWSFLDKLPNCPRAMTLEAYDALWFPALAMAAVERKCEDISSLRLHK